MPDDYSCLMWYPDAGLLYAGLGCGCPDAGLTAGLGCGCPDAGLPAGLGCLLWIVVLARLLVQMLDCRPGWAVAVRTLEEGRCPGEAGRRF